MDRIKSLSQMLPEDIDAALITSDVNRRYYTGFASSAGALLVTRENAVLLLDSRYVEAGAKKVLISAPGKGEMKTVVYNVNDEILVQGIIDLYYINEKDELSGICFCLLDVFIAVINCLSIHKLANDLNELCLSFSKLFTALYNPIIPS